MSSSPKTSTANKPDLDWSQVRETINMLTLAVSQVECTMTDGEKSIAELTHSFTFIANQLQNIVDTKSKKTAEEQLNTIKENAADIHQKVVTATIAFQFYDRLTQRLDHVKRDLSWLSSLVSSPDQLYNPEAWQKLQTDIMSNYTMEEERLMFEHIMNGASVESALEIYNHHFNRVKDDDDQTNDEIELF
ncbi:MAG: hypothetical protein ACJAWS_001755 [Oleiphilaceae bacterium]